MDCAAQGPSGLRKQLRQSMAVPREGGEVRIARKRNWLAIPIAYQDHTIENTTPIENIHIAIEPTELGRPLLLSAAILEVRWEIQAAKVKWCGLTKCKRQPQAIAPNIVPDCD